jgi:hypothetical protein
MSQEFSEVFHFFLLKASGFVFFRSAVGFPSPPQISCPLKDVRFANRGPSASRWISVQAHPPIRASTHHLHQFSKLTRFSTRFFMDVQTEIMHFFIHGCLAAFIDKSGASYASLIADGSAHTDNPRIQIKHPLFHLVMP